MGGPPAKRPIRRDEPEDESTQPGASTFPPEPTTLRPPTPGAEDDGSSNYEMLRDSCRATEAAEPVDDELAIEAEIVRVVLDRESQRVKKA
jgi:hypothetical protein